MRGGMDRWYPPNDQPHLLEWWRPLLLASRAARVERLPWPLHIDEVQLVGRVDRGAEGRSGCTDTASRAGRSKSTRQARTSSTHASLEKHTAELQSLMRISYAGLILKKQYY